MIANLSIKLRLAFSIAILALITNLLISNFSSHISRAQIEHDQSALLENIAVRMTAQLAHDMSARANEILFLTQLDRITDPKYPAEKKRAIFEAVHQSYPFYAWIGMTDTVGNIIAGTDGFLIGKNVAKRDWFIKGQDELYFGDAHDAFLLAKLMPKPKWDDLPLRLVDVAAPVHDESGKFIGVICGHLSMDWTFEARELMLDQLNNEKIDLVVLNSEGKVLMGTPRLPSLKVDLSSLSAFKLSRTAGRSFQIETWPDGESYFTVAVRETPFRNYSGMGWSVVARVLESNATASAVALSRLIQISGLITALLFAVILWIVLSRTLRPLEEISHAAQRIHDNDLTFAIPQPHGSGEIAVFARSLTNLVHSLQERNAELRLTSRVFEESGQGIIITNTKNQIVRVNQAFINITGYALENIIGKTPAILKSGRQDANFYQKMWQRIVIDGHWQGEIWNRTHDGKIYPEWLTINALRENDGTISHYIAQFDDITEKKHYEQRLEHLANYDLLTDLPNRNLMQNQVTTLLEQMRHNNAGLALLFIDLDKFKHINDTLGHPAGDMVLKEVATRFNSAITKDSILARWGGDEFVVVIPRADAILAVDIARQMIESLRRPFSIEGGSYHISTSIGIAIYPIDGRNVDNLLRCADTAMYKAKREGANLYHFYESAMNAGVERFLKIDNALHHALDNNGLGLKLFFHPQWNIKGDRILSAEVLIRWKHPELGNVSPGQFIPVAEETGQIIPLGNWIIEKALEAHAELARSGHVIPLAINCSAHQLRTERFAENIISLSKAHRVPAEQIIIEVTESAVMSDERIVAETLTTLKKHGYGISIDDFGTGYSCLSYIQRLHPSEIKIDQGFVATILTAEDSRNIVSFILGLAGSMHMEVVAEGVETIEQLNALRQMGDMKIQGYLLAKPMPLDAFQELLNQNLS